VLTSLMWLITQLLEGSRHKESLLLLEMKMLIINPRDTHNLYFHTLVQEQAFFSSLMECTVFTHQRVDFDYLESKPVLAGWQRNLRIWG
jgi:hypothetical protein